jgi:hypothetical protein
MHCDILSVRQSFRVPSLTWTTWQAAEKPGFLTEFFDARKEGKEGRACVSAKKPPNFAYFCSAIWAPNVGADGVTTRRFAWLKRDPHAVDLHIFPGPPRRFGHECL